MSNVVSAGGKKLLLRFCLLLFACMLINCQLPAKAFYADSLLAVQQQVWELVNEYRAEHSLPALKMNDVITQAATGHSANMAAGRVPFGHEGFETRVGGLLKALAPANAGAENVADGSLDAKKAVDLWLHSAGHRKNIEGNFNLTGVGIAQAGDGKLYFTQIFVNKQ